MEERLKRRKLDALKRGVHRVPGGEALPVSTHIVGIGRAGAEIVAQTLRALSPGAPKITALVVDIGEADLAALRTLVAGLPPELADVTVVGLTVPPIATLVEEMARYPEYLALEYPRFAKGAAFEPWLDESVVLLAPGAPMPRAVAKAIYGLAYYAGERQMAQVLRRFAESVEATGSQAMIAMVFGLGGGTGSGIAVDLARHLSTCLLGRRVLMAAIAVAPCGGDVSSKGVSARSGRQMFALLNELDVLGDEEKSRGVVMACGELYRNPFTAGFVMVPQEQVWQASGDLGATHERVDAEIAALLTTGGGANLWELLRLLNWVAAPSTQHSAARTPWGPRWIHVLAFADTDGGAIAPGEGLTGRLGLLPSYAPEFVELRVSGLDEAAKSRLAETMEQTLCPDVAPAIVDGGRPGSVQFVLPCVAKTHLAGWFGWRAAYDAAPLGARLLAHSMLLEQGVLLSEPSSRLDGMAGASLWGESWVAVPYEGMRGDEPPPPHPKILPSLPQLRETV